MRALIYIIVGAVIAALGIWWIMAEGGQSVMSIVAALVTGVGGAVIVSGIATAFDLFAPTSKKL